jgi:hypothetical protein
MKKLLIALCLTCALALAVQAEGAKKQHKALTDEQKAIQKEMLAKYDTNKDGKLQKEEKAKMSTEDKEKYAKAFPAHKKQSK